MMLGLGIVLIINPVLLSGVMVSIMILASSLTVSLLVATMAKKCYGG